MKWKKGRDTSDWIGCIFEVSWFIMYLIFKEERPFFFEPMNYLGQLYSNYQTLEAIKSTGEWTNWFIQAMEYFSALKTNELSSLETTWRKRKCSLLSERSQSEKATCCMILTIWQKGKTMETVKDQCCRRVEVGWEMSKWSTGDF